MKRSNEKFKTEEQKEVIRFIKVLLVVVVIVVVVYFATRAFVTKDLFPQEAATSDTVQAGSIDYSVTILGASLNRPEDEYYVIVYDSTSRKASMYGTLVSNYVAQKTHTKVYFADLNNHLNKDYYSDSETNPKAKSVEELKVGDFTLFQVKKGKIVSYLEDYERAKEVLAVKK